MKTNTGRTPARVTRVSLQEIKNIIVKETKMKKVALMNMLMLVLSPCYTTSVSDDILLRISPVLFSSKNPTSLFIRK